MKKDKIKAALYGFCIGDALGAPVEFMTKNWIKIRYKKVMDYKSGFLTIPYFLKTAGSGTDDTRFMLALYKGILENRKDPVKAIGKEFNKLRLYPLFIGRNLLLDFLFYFGNWHATSKFVDKLLKGRTAGNGALMRCLPVALLYDDYEKMVEVTRIQATMTHWNEISTQSCIIYNTIVFHLIKGKTLNEAVNFAIKDTEYVFFDIHTTEPNGFAPNTLKHVIYWLLHTDSFEEAVLSAVNEGGDTDTIAALVGAIAGIHYGMENIPEKWIDKLKAKKQINNLII